MTLLPASLESPEEEGPDGLVPEFTLEANDLELTRRVQPFSPFDKVGRRFAILGREGGTFEAWGYPIKILRNFEFSFLLANSTEKISGRETARWITVTPEATVITFTHQQFVVRAIFVTPVNEPGAIILLDVDSREPVTVVAGFIPVLQPMWPAGIGGQYAAWDKEMDAYVISEPRHQNVGFVGSPGATGISYSPAHMLSDVPLEFKIEVDPETAAGKFVPVVLAGGAGDPGEFKKIYENLSRTPERYYRENVAHFRNLRDSTLEIVTPVREIDLAFEWAKVAYDNLVVTNPFLGTGLVAGLGISGTSGRPGFGWYFSGDIYINSLSLVSAGAFNIVRQSLEFSRKWQREDGKMAHELSQSAFRYVDWFEDYHYGYIHGDTTPWYVVATADYFRSTGDLPFIRENWPSLKRAYQWSLATDENGDGLMDNRAAGLGALEFGPLTGIVTDVYLAAIWVKAIDSMRELAEAVGDHDLAERSRETYGLASRTLNERLWDEDAGLIGYAFNEDNEIFAELNPWSGPGIMWDLFDPEKSRATLARINTSELTTDWGIRCLTNRSSYYEPLNYNYGAVWPFVTSFVATALYRHHFAEAGLAGLMSTVRHTFDNSLGNVTEVFSGDRNVWPAEAVHHQGFCSAGAVLPLVRGLLGLETDAVKHTVTFAPHLPADWDRLEVNTLKVGSSLLDLILTRRETEIALQVTNGGEEPVTLTFSPALRTGQVSGVRVNGDEAEFHIVESPQDIHVSTTFPVTKQANVVIEHTPSFRTVFPTPVSRTGDPNRGLKVLETQRIPGGLRFHLEGVPGKTYGVKILGPEYVENVLGGRLREETIEVTFPAEKRGEFVRTTLEITGKP